MEIRKVYRSSHGLFETIEQALVPPRVAASDDPAMALFAGGAVAHENYDAFSPHFGQREHPVEEYVLFADGHYFQLEKIQVQRAN